MARKNAGDSLRYTAADWNRHEAAADDYERRVTSVASAAEREVISTGIIRLKNSSGADRRQGEILQVGNCLLTDIERRYAWFDAELHDGSDSPFAVLLEPIPDDQIGRAQIAGVCPALVNFTQADQPYGRLDPAGSDVLIGAALGQVRVLHKPSGTGELLCLVHLADGRFEQIGETDEAIAGDAASAGTVNILNPDLTDSGLDEECYVLGEDGAGSGVKGGISLIGNRLWFTPIEGC